MSSLWLRLSAVALLFLFAIPVVPAMALTSPSPPSTAAPAAPAVSAAGNGRFTPDYMLLGQLEGSAVVQSSRPRSASLLGGVQFSATYYTANDLQNAYGASSLIASSYGGEGKTIAIIDAYGDPTINQDLATFDRQSGLPPASLSIIPVGPYNPVNGITYGWDAETALDVEAAHAMAPQAHINLVVAANASNALFSAVKTVVDEHLGDVVSMSWGLGENSFGESGFSAAGFLNYAYLDYYFQKGAAEGITFFASSGDYGAFSGTTGVTAGFPASSPFVTGVGGTTLYLSTSSGFYSSAQYQGEAAWSVSPQYVGSPGVSSGGGYSELFARPSYQAGAVSGQTRGVPDVSADANPYTGFTIVLEGGDYIIGGTSLSSPLWAGMAADLDQYVGKDLGALNPYLYSIYSDPQAYGSSFHQVTFGYNGVYSASPGYNLVTGLGSPDLPQLARYVRALSTNQEVAPGSGTQGLSVSVHTSAASSASAPAQYSYGDTLTISATAVTAAGSPVDTGAFTAQIDSPAGHIASVPLTLSGGVWTGSYTVGQPDPPGSWTITVTASSGGATGTGFADVDVGDSLAILSPVPYPFGAPVTVGVPFRVFLLAASPSGKGITGQAFTAYLLYGGKAVQATQMSDKGGGEYSVYFTIGALEPQGTYTLVVNASGVGSVYSYFYVGLETTGVVLGPNDEAIPSAAPGQLVTLLDQVQTPNGKGRFTSTVTAYMFAPSGTLVASVPLEPAPNTAQFSAFNFFYFQQANFTIPQGLPSGFYTIQFLSSYAANATAIPDLGNFTTGFYVSPPTLSYTVSHASSLFEGQDLTIMAKITTPSGVPVTSGVFFATATPTGYAYEAYLTDAFGYTGVPMQYVPSIGEWEGVYQIPSTLTSPSPFTGNTLTLNQGSWAVFVSGESSTAVNVVPAESYVDVLPYTYIGTTGLSPSTAGSAPLVTANGTEYYLRSAAADSLTISGLNLTLAADSIGSLTISGSNVTLDGTRVGSLSATDSVLSLTAGSRVDNLTLSYTRLSMSGSSYGRLSPAKPSFQVAGLSSPFGTKTAFLVTITGSQVDNATLSLTVDGAPLSATVTAVPGGYTMSGSVDPSAMADGTHIMQVNATQSDGVTTSFSSTFSTDAQVASLQGKIDSVSRQAALWADSSYVLAAIAILAIVISLWAARKKPAPSASPPGPGEV